MAIHEKASPYKEKTSLSSDADYLAADETGGGKVIFLVDGRIKDNIFAYDKDLEIGDEILCLIPTQNGETSIVDWLPGIWVLWS